MGRAEDLLNKLLTGQEAAIDELILDQRSEELFLDFKRAATNAASRHLHGDDRANLAKAISGFGNSEGGVIVWGVDCRDRPGVGDLPGSKVPFENPKRFVSWLEGAVSGCTLPPHAGVRNEVIYSSTEPGKGFAVTYIAKSNLAPHQVVQPQPSYYYIRAGSNFLPSPHGVLAGLFGRRPQPTIGHNFFTETALIFPAFKMIRLVFVLNLLNQGPGLARDIYLNVSLWPPKGQTNVRSDFLGKEEHWTHEMPGGFGIMQSFVSRDPYRLSPMMPVSMARFEMQLFPPFESAFSMKLQYGCEGSPTTERVTRLDESALLEVYDMFFQGNIDGTQVMNKLFGDLLGPR